ncbi:hypothetical protein AB0F43_10770 [Kribbella sp. NPDC023972]|uniref:hypothetical protein n=1 Tax=Kribbella sp. NPDC023972 TaxID=3154795 RepID=UPI0033E4E226
MVEQGPSGTRKYGRAGAAELQVPEPESGGQVRSAGADAATPLTERILAVLPGPRSAWVAVWALVPWMNLALATAISGAATGGSRVPLAEVLNRAAVTIAILLSLWGAATIAAELRTIRPTLTEIVDEDERDVARLFRGIDSVVGPLILVVAVAVILPLDEAQRGDPAGAALQAGTWLVIGIPVCTAVWAYVVLQAGLNRLGAGQVSLQGYNGDRSLGLLPIGRLAFTGFWMLVGTVAPLVVTSFADRPTQIVGITVLIAAIALLFVSLRRVHRQMAAVKQREISRALTLYQEAYRELRERPGLEVLQRQASLLKAAEDLEKRAEHIRAWPFAEGTFTWVLAIALGSTATIIARLLLTTAGL